MQTPGLEVVLSQARRLAGGRSYDALTDRELLESFLRGDEQAFAALVRRHGPMVRGVCCRILGQESDADDAFQATFLVLAQTARSIRNKASVAGWLYGVASRLARKARIRAHKASSSTHKLERKAFADPAMEAARREMVAILDAEVFRLPEKYREAIVLCYLEGETRDQAAHQLGWSVRTLRRRLERGKELLRMRLSRRGLELSAVLLAASLTPTSTRAVSPALVKVVLHAAGPAMACTSVSPSISSNVLALAAEMSRAATIARVVSGMVWAAAIGIAATGAGFLALQILPDGRADDATARPGGGVVKRENENSGRIDDYGDQLPTGAVRRLGASRFRPGNSQVTGLRYIPDGKALISSGNRGVQVWRAADGKLLREFAANEEDSASRDPDDSRSWSWAVGAEVRQNAASPDGAILAIAQDNSIELRNLTTGRESCRLRTPPEEAKALVFSADGKTLASAGAGGIIRLWDVTSGKQLRTLPVSIDRTIFLAITPNGKTIVAGDDQETHISLLDVASGKERHRLNHKNETPGSFALSPDGSQLAAGYYDWTVVIWDVSSGKPVRECRVKQQYTFAVTFSPDGKCVAFASDDGIFGGLSCRVHIWSVATGKELNQWKGPGAWAETLAYSPDGTTLAGGCADGAIHRWDPKTGADLHVPGDNLAHIQSVSFSPDAREAAVITWDDIQIWEAATGKDLGHLMQLPRSKVATPAFSPDWGVIAVGRQDGVVSIWDRASRRLIRELRPQQPALGGPAGMNQISSVTFSPDGKRLAVADFGGTIRLWNWESGQQLTQFIRPRHIDWLSFSPDGATLCAQYLPPGSGSNALKFLDAVTGDDLKWLDVASNALFKKPSYRKYGRSDVPYCVAFSADGKLAACTAGQKSIAVLELSSGKERLRLRETRDSFTCALSPDGRTLASAGFDNSIRFWDLATGKQIGTVAGQANSLVFSPDGKTLLSGGNDTTALIWDVARIVHHDVPAAGRLAPEDLEKLWSDLGNLDARKGHQAIWALAFAPAQTLAFFKTHLRAAVSENYVKAKEAPARLERPIVDPATLRSIRAIEVLEHIGTTDARKVLESLVAEAPANLVTAIARAALKRLTQRP